MDPLLWGVDLTVTEVLGVDESRQTVLQSSSYPNTLSRTASIIKMLPYLQDTPSDVYHTHVYIYIIYIYIYM